MALTVVNLHHLVQRLTDAAVVIDESVEREAFDTGSRRDLARQLRGTLLLLEEIGARALGAEEIPGDDGWLAFADELELGRGRLEGQIIQVLGLLVPGTDGFELELALTRLSGRIRSHTEAETAMFSLGSGERSAPPFVGRRAAIGRTN